MFSAHCFDAVGRIRLVFFFITITIRLCREQTFLHALLVSHIMQTAFNELGDALLGKKHGWSTTCSHRTWDLGRNMLCGQRALRLWLELIALIEHFLSFCTSCTLTTSE